MKKLCKEKKMEREGKEKMVLEEREKKNGRKRKRKDVW
jgi:hypothetical protein